MSEPEGSDAVPYRPDPDTAIRVGWIVTMLGLLLFVVSALGEYLGWWDLVGEVGMLVGTVVSVVVGFGTWLSGASQRQLSSVGDRVDNVGVEVSGVRHVVEANGATLASVDGKLDRLDELDKLERLDKLDKLDGLDEIEARLEGQSGLLGKQLDVLGEIRDAV